MLCQVEIYDEVLAAIDGWGLHDDVKHKLLRMMLNDLSTKLTKAIGSIHSVAPVRLYRYCLAIPDPSGACIHNMVFLVNATKERRIVVAGCHRTSAGEF